MSASVFAIAFLLMCGLSKDEITANYLIRDETACKNILRIHTEVYPEKSCRCLPVVVPGDYVVIP
jgi:hypothetical protein